MANSKGTKGQKSTTRTVVERPYSSNDKIIRWSFEKLDRNGKFCFNIHRPDFNVEYVFRRILDYSTMTWNEILAMRHDDGKSSNHSLDYDGLSDDARARVENMKIEEDTDSIFSLRLDNMHRLIGIRRNETLEVRWYDPKHEFYPSTKK